MLRRRMAGALIVVSLAAAPARAQVPGTAPRQLSLAQALELARRNSPTYRQAETAADPAAEAVKAADWARLPTLSLNSGVGYTGAGSQTFGGQVFASSPTLQSNYGFSAGVQLSTRVFLTPSIQRAQLHFTEENINAAGVNLVSNVTSQYLNVLRARATVDVAIRQITSDTTFLAFARARQQVGQASLIDVLQAQTTMATAQVQLLQARQAETQAKITLIQFLGLPGDANVDSLTLTEPFPLVEPKFDLATLEGMAGSGNPGIRALEAQDHANALSVRAARLDRLPTFSISAGLSGYTQQFTDENILISNQLSSAQAAEANCVFQNQIIEGLTTPIPGGIIPDCKAFAGLDPTGNALQPSEIASIRNTNAVFPFAFTRQPLSLNVRISLPIWDAYNGSLRISQAEAAADAGREGLRAQRLATDALIQSQLLAVSTAWQRTQIQDTNRVTARQQLQLAQDRYRIGNGSALDLATAQNALTQSEADYVTAVYDYHLAVVGLEAAVGRPLR
jgi:outer membrane protein TolC